jgi:hypothetical protein
MFWALSMETGSGDSMQMVYWNTIKDSRNPADFRTYVTKFPGGLFVEIANSRIASLESEARDAARAKEIAVEEELRRNTRIFEVRDADGTEGSRTVNPGALSFEPKKANPKKNLTIECAQIKRVEPGNSDAAAARQHLAASSGKERTVVLPRPGGHRNIRQNTCRRQHLQRDRRVVNACKMANQPITSDPHDESRGQNDPAPSAAPKCVGGPEAEPTRCYCAGRDGRRIGWRFLAKIPLFRASLLGITLDSRYFVEKGLGRGRVGAVYLREIESCTTRRL